MDNRELIWVEKDFAKKYNLLDKESGKNEERLKALDDYIVTVAEETRQDFKANLESLEEDVAIYMGLNLKVRQSFEKAKNEAFNASYTLWEEYQKELPNLEKKIKMFTDKLTPLAATINQTNELLGKIDTFNIEKVVNTIENISRLHGEQKDMIAFLIKNFKSK